MFGNYLCRCMSECLSFAVMRTVNGIVFESKPSDTLEIRRYSIAFNLLCIADA